MNGLQIIKTLALKIRYSSIVEWYNFWSIVLHHHQNIVPTVASIDETIRHITEGNRSISRFGDGEMLLTSPSKSIGFQEGSPLLAKRLREVLVRDRRTAVRGRGVDTGGRVYFKTTTNETHTNNTHLT